MMQFLIISALFVVQGLAFANPATQIMSRKIEIGWDSCRANSPLKLRCSTDCEKLEYCMNGRQYSISCLEQTGKRYCDVETNSCRDDIDVCYNSRDFCPRDGIFPDLTNCHRYVYCTDNTMNPYQCEYNTVWNYKTGECDYKAACYNYTRSTGCGASNSIVPHQNPHWFVFCSWGRPILAECPGVHYTFDKNTGNCRFQCEHQENVRIAKYPDERNPSIYYNCYKVNGTWETTQKSCLAGYYFDQHKQVCTRGPGTPSSVPTSTE